MKSPSEIVPNFVELTYGFASSNYITARSQEKHLSRKNRNGLPDYAYMERVSTAEDMHLGKV